MGGWYVETKSIILYCSESESDAKDGKKNRRRRKRKLFKSIRKGSKGSAQEVEPSGSKSEDASPSRKTTRGTTKDRLERKREKRMLWKMKKKTEEKAKEKDEKKSRHKKEESSDKDLRSSGEVESRRKGGKSLSKSDRPAVAHLKRRKSSMPQLGEGLQDWEIDSPREDTSAKEDVTTIKVSTEKDLVVGGEEEERDEETDGNKTDSQNPPSSSNEGGGEGNKRKKERKSTEHLGGELGPLMKRRSNSLNELYEHDREQEQDGGDTDREMEFKSFSEGSSQLKMLSSFNLREIQNEPELVPSFPPPGALYLFSDWCFFYGCSKQYFQQDRKGK